MAKFEKLLIKLAEGALPFDKIQFPAVKEAGDFAGFFALLVMLLRFCYYSNSSS